MGTTKFKRLLCFALSLAMAFALIAAPAYAATEPGDNDSSITLLSLTADEDETETETEAAEAPSEESVTEDETEEPASEPETEEPTEEPTDEPTETPTEEPTETPTEESTQTAAQAVQAQIDALPTVDEVAVMDLDEQNEVYTAFSNACEAYDALSEDEQAQVDDSALDTLAAYFNGEITTTATLPTSGALTSGTYTLTSDITLDGTLTIASGQTVIIDLNGYTVSYTDAVLSPTVYMIENSGTLTITDNSADGNGMLLMKATATSTSTSGRNYAACVILNTGVLYLYGGTLKTTSVYKQARGVTIASGGKDVVLDGANIIVESISNSQLSCGIYAGTSTANVSIISGSITVECTNESNTAAAYGIYGLTAGCTVDVSGGEITVSGYSTNSPYVNGIYGFTNTTVSGGEITVTNNSEASGSNAYGVRGKDADNYAEITGGTITVSSAGTGGTGYGAGRANISGDTKITADKLLDTCSVTGGTYSFDVTPYLAEGYTAITNSDGTYTVGIATSTNVASVTVIDVTTPYTSLSAAVTAANEASSDATITLLDNVTLESSLTVTPSSNGVTVTLNLDSHTLTIDSGYTFDIRDVTLSTGSGITIGASGILIAPDSWNGKTPSETSVEAESGATMYIYGIGYTYGTDWSLSGTYLVEYYKGEKTSTEYTYPDAVETNTIFAGWYTDSGYKTPCDTDTTSGVAYAKFVNLENKGGVSAVINYLGSSLRKDGYYTDATQTTVDYTTTNLRFGYDIAIPTGCTIDSWDWNYTSAESSAIQNVDGTSKTDATTTYDDATAFCSNLVVTGITSSLYKTDIKATLTVTYETADGTTVTATGTQRTSNVYDVATALQNSTDDSDYANNIIKVASSS